MKKLLITLALFLPLSASAETIVANVEGMTCDHCAQTITAALETRPGVEKVEIDIAAKRVTIEAEGTSNAEIREAIEAAGYDVNTIERK